MKPFLLKEVIKDLDGSSGLLNALLSDSEALTKTLFIKDGDWKQSVYWKMGKIIEDLNSHKRVLQKIYDILPSEPKPQGKEVKESTFFSVISEFSLKLDKINERLNKIEGNIVEKPQCVKEVTQKPIKSLKEKKITPQVIVKTDSDVSKKKRGRPKKS